MKERLSYARAGVDIDRADATKRDMARSLETADERVLNRIGAFASLFDARFPGYEHPILVLKSEEPGSKQKLALQHGRRRSLCQDLVHHLINDIAVMGAEPLSVQDVIVCGHLEKEAVNEMVDALAQACRAQGCTLTGGETSEQPGVVDKGIYILTASVVGVVEKSLIIDGSKIEQGDHILVAPSNGLHTNGYSLVRALLAEKPGLAEADVEGESFLDVALRPHLCYYQALRGLYRHPGVHGLAHITGGGIAGNLNRVLPANLDAQIDLSRLRVPPVFHLLRQWGELDEADMLRTFNMGAGLALVVAADAAAEIADHLQTRDCPAYAVGEIAPGKQQVAFRGHLDW